MPHCTVELKCPQNLQLAKSISALYCPTNSTFCRTSGKSPFWKALLSITCILTCTLDPVFVFFIIFASLFLRKIMPPAQARSIYFKNDSKQFAFKDADVDALGMPCPLLSPSVGPYATKILLPFVPQPFFTFAPVLHS